MKLYDLDEPEIRRKLCRLHKLHEKLVFPHPQFQGTFEASSM